MAKRIQLLLRCIIPSLENGTLTQDVVVAPCEKGRHRVGQSYGLKRPNSAVFSNSDTQNGRTFGDLKSFRVFELFGFPVSSTSG